MRKSAVLLITSLIASFAFAVGDPNPDSFGIYFDTAGNTYDMHNIPSLTPFNMYLILANPSAPTNGFECTISSSGAPLFVLSTILSGTGAVDLDSSANGYLVGTTSDYPVVGGVIVLCTWQFMMQTTAPTDFRVGAATIPSLPSNLPVVTGNGVLRLCGVRSGSAYMAVAWVNANRVTPSEVSTFGCVKLLFR